MMRFSLERVGFWAWAGLVYAFLLAPLVVVAGASFSGLDPVAKAAAPNPTLGYVRFPPQYLTLEWYVGIPTSQFRALGISLALAIASAVGAALIGVPAALGIVRSQFPGKQVVVALLRAPLQIPSIVVGIAFLRFYYAVGNATGVQIGASFLGLLIAHIFLTAPYVIGAVSAILLRFNARLEEAALSLGASRWSTFRRVTLPVIMPGAYAGILYAFLVSFADVPVSLFLAGPGLATYPVEIFFSSEADFSPTILASATVVMVFSLGVLLFMQRMFGLET
ncbi:MAG: ABC transporter permease, partial [Alphaproteobacteria bacterium]|nr:ABC transporter permease [Alphaproteobacteria bacterium]